MNLYRINNEGQVQTLTVLGTEKNTDKKPTKFHVTDKIIGNQALCIPVKEVDKTWFTSVEKAKADLSKALKNTITYYEKALVKLETIK